MRVGLLGRKVGMTQIYQENGTVVPVTVLECGPCTVLQVRTAGSRRLSRLAARLRRQEAQERHPGRAGPCQARSTPSPSDSSARSARTGRPRSAEGQTLTVELFKRDHAGRRDRHQQGPRLRGRHEAARVPRPAGHARRQADAPPPRLVGPQRRPGPHPEGHPQAGPLSAMRRSRSGTSRSSGSTRPTTCS